ncbi:hypothetical protein Tco_0737066 [Tanacetum coccineum]
MLPVVDSSAGQEAPSVTHPQLSYTEIPPPPSTTQPSSSTIPLPTKSTIIPPTPISQPPSPFTAPEHATMQHSPEQPSPEQPLPEQPSPEQPSPEQPSPRQESDIPQTQAPTHTHKAATGHIEVGKESEETGKGCQAHASGEEQVEDIIPTTLEAAAILTKILKRLSMLLKKLILVALKLILSLSTFIRTDGRRRKGSMTEEEETQASKKTKEQILQEEAGLAKAIRLDALEKALEKEAVAKQVHLDSLLAQRMVEEQELIDEQKKRKA